MTSQARLNSAEFEFCEQTVREHDPKNLNAVARKSIASKKREQENQWIGDDLIEVTLPAPRQARLDRRRAGETNQLAVVVGPVHYCRCCGLWMTCGKGCEGSIVTGVSSGSTWRF
jgi:hypothetical protein